MGQVLAILAALIGGITLAIIKFDIKIDLGLKDVFSPKIREIRVGECTHTVERDTGKVVEKICPEAVRSEPKTGQGHINRGSGNVFEVEVPRKTPVGKNSDPPDGWTDVTGGELVFCADSNDSDCQHAGQNAPCILGYRRKGYVDVHAGTLTFRCVKR